MNLPATQSAAMIAITRNGGVIMCSTKASNGKSDMWQPPIEKAERKSNVNGRLMFIAKILNDSGHGTLLKAFGMDERSCAKRIKSFTWPTTPLSENFSPVWALDMLLYCTLYVIRTVDEGRSDDIDESSKLSRGTELRANRYLPKVPGCDDAMTEYRWLPKNLRHQVCLK